MKLDMYVMGPEQILTVYFTESQLLHDWRFTANQFVWATSPLTLTTSSLLTEHLQL
jgi:hypothetical protein